VIDEPVGKKQKNLHEGNAQNWPSFQPCISLSSILAREATFTGAALPAPMKQSS
jgi:hypothetical protein